MPPPLLGPVKQSAVATPAVAVTTPAPVRTPPVTKKPPPLPASNAAMLAALRAGDKKPLPEQAPKELQDKVGNGAVAAGLTRSPGADPKFAVLKKDVARKKRTVATSHPPARKEATSAQDASVPPKDDAVAQGKTANAEKMNDAKPKDFDKDAFIKAVEKAIADKAPKNLDEADKFADSDKPAEIKQDVQGKVGEGKADSAEQIATTTAAPPDTSAAEVKTVVPMAADRPPGTPATPDPAKATPDTLPPSATDMSAGPAAVNQQMTDAQVTEPQLKKSNEPSFNTALKDKKTAEHHSDTAPGQLRKHEAGQLNATTAQAKRLGTNAMGAIATQRVRTGAKVGTGKTGAKSRDEDKRTQVTALLQKCFDTMKTDVEGILTGLDKLVDDQFTRGEKDARDAFTAEHRRKMDEYKDKRYGGWDGWIKWGHDKLFGLPEEANLIFVEARDHYVKAMKQVISDVADTIGRELTRAKTRIAKGREELQNEVKKLPKDLQAIGKEAAAGFSDQFDALTQSVDDKSGELVDTLATKYTDAVKSVDDEIAAEKEKNKGLVDKAIDAVKGVIKTIMELKDLLLGVLAKAAQAVMGIIRDPIGFLGNLITGVGGGLKQFMKNAGRHLQAGVLAWLLGTAATAGIQLPTSFDIMGILMLLATLLGLTWANIRSRIVRKVPEQAVAAAETAVPLVLEVRRRGVAGMWDNLKTRVGDLKKDLIGNIVEYLLPTIIIAGITWIVSLFNPASAFIRACKMIIDIVRFIITNGRQIIEFINSVLDAIIAISKGSTGGVAAKIEDALARSIPVLIGALAAILGIGGIASKVKEIFQKIARPVNKAVDWVVDKIIGLVKKLWAKLKSLGKKVKDKFRKKKPEEPKRSEDKPKDDTPEREPRPTVKVPFQMSGAAHTLTMKPSGKGLTVTMASVELPLTKTFSTAHNRIDNFREYIESIEDPEVKQFYKDEFEAILKRFKVPTVQDFTAIYDDFFPSGEAPKPLPKTQERQAAAKVKPLVTKAQNALHELETWANEVHLAGLAPDDFETLIQKGQDIWKARWQTIQQEIDAILDLPAFKYKGKRLEYRGSVKKGFKGERKGRVRFDASDFDLDLYAVDADDYDRISRDRPTAVLGDKIFADNGPAELQRLESRLQAKLRDQFKGVNRIGESSIVLRRVAK